MILDVKVRMQCTECGGSGHREHAPYCRECLQTISQRAIAEGVPNDDMMPCGHPWSKLVEEELCGECEGAGEVEAWIPFKELCNALMAEWRKEQRWPGQIPP